MSPSPRILSIGQCGVDHAAISRLFRTEFSVTVDSADSLPEADELLGDNTYALVLVNRVLDADGSSGVSVLQNLIARHPSVPMMLISNYPDAQQEAMRLGAVEGFGKSSLHHDRTRTLLRNVLNPP
jgi:two-component system chemotaxis response regulator CheY